MVKKYTIFIQEIWKKSYQGMCDATGRAPSEAHEWLVMWKKY